MEPRLITLKNRHLVARFSPDDGRLVHLSEDGLGVGLTAGMSLRYRDREMDRWHTDDEGATAPRIESVSVTATDTSVTAVSHSEHLRMTLRYELPEESPLLRVSSEVQGRGKAGTLTALAIPRLLFAPDFVDAFEDEADLYSDGAEVDGGRELPCWRVFFREGHQAGLMLATRGKKDMAQFSLLGNGLDLRPNHFANYSTALVEYRYPLRPGSRTTHQVSFEIGPWSRAQHEILLRTARLNEAVPKQHLPARGSPRSRLTGDVFYAVDFATDEAVAASYDPTKWAVAEMPWAQKGRALFATTGVRPPALTLDPRLEGVYRVFVGIGNGSGITIHLSGDPEPSFRVPPPKPRPDAPEKDRWCEAFSLFLSGSHRPAEVSYGIARMDGRGVRLERFPNGQGATVVDYVRFEKLSPAQTRTWLADQDRKPCIPLSGFSDVPSIAPLTDAVDPDPRAYRAVIWEHANCGFSRIYWRIDGQCSDYPSRVNTMRYISARVHGVFSPRAKAYGSVLKRVDMLALAVEAARERGVELYGWMRFNNYTGNVQSDFYKNNPAFWEEWEHGASGGKLCLAIPEVRRHKIDILVEAAGYGLHGLNLGFLRHPPILLYHPVIVESFRKEFGVLPPRDPHASDPRFINSLPPPPDEEHTRWYQHRAAYMAQFGRELRAALREHGLGHVKVSIWVRPNHCLFDGIDLPAWLDEGLCDEVVVNGMIGPDIVFSESPDETVTGVRPEWKRMVQARVPVIRCLCYRDIRRWQQHLPQVLAEGYDGLCTYESDWSVLDTDFRALYRSL
jgi:hypothetical protein